VCATFKQGGVTPIAIGLSLGENWQTLLWFDYLNIRINGLDFRNELMLEGETRFDDDRVRAVFITLETLVEDGYFDEDARRRTGNQAILSVLDGEAAMTLVGHGAMDMIPQTRWNEMDLFRFPVIDPEIPLGEAPGIEGFVIPANTTELQAATQFLAHRGSAEAQALWAEQCGPPGGVPARIDVDPAVLTPHMQRAQEMLEETDELGQLIFWTGSPMVDVIITRIGSWFDDPGTLDELLDKLEARRQEVFEE
jgi:multiple sugar transport system substrate-binding protein/raffinose/stachyose/melibiose transport system substrate-binding protein